MNSALASAVVVVAVSLVGCDSLVKYEPAPTPPTSSITTATTMPIRGNPATLPSDRSLLASPAAIAPAAIPPAATQAAMIEATPMAVAPMAIAKPSDRPATQPVDAGGPAVTLPFTVERFEHSGPIRGVVARVDLTDPRVSMKVALADPRDPDGAGPAVGRLATVAHAAQANGLALAMNASFYKIVGSRVIAGKNVGYFVGNGAWPVGWHAEDGRVVSTPVNDDLRATVIVHQNRQVTLEANVHQLPADAAYAVSGNMKVLSDGIATVGGVDLLRHPRSAIGLSADGKTLLFVVVDGRRDGWSGGATLGELATLMKSLGASDAINLDGGGSSDLVVRDAVTGVYAIANRPSEHAALTPGLDSVERPVVDVIGVDVKE